MKALRFLLIFLAAAGTFTAITAFIISDWKPDYINESPNDSEFLSLESIETENTEEGSFKSIVQFQHKPAIGEGKAFYGQLLQIKDHPSIDEVYIGITNKLISRVEIWNKGNRLEVKELGFVGKMSWGALQSLQVDYTPMGGKNNPNVYQLSMRFYSGNGFFGDIASLRFILDDYGDISQGIRLGFFEKTLDSEHFQSPSFSQHEVWKDYQSFD